MSKDVEADENLDMIVEGTNLGKWWHQMSLVDKIISYECGIHNCNFEQLKQFWQELIDRGICWHDDMPPHYARTARAFIENGHCSPSSAPLPAPKAQQFGADEWDRPPQHEDWGRPFRWKQLRRERLRIVKLKKRIFDKTGEYPSCCKRGSGGK